nr:hypothetical protein Iba_chr12aCG24340 [Ipomoea batatas]GMD67374.1 hypothetical protein Iba_chr12cCG23960 [Ipomoea batatas]GMD69635.1 hypothetical protein Iba_chr12dCG20930 [Ipomoea batatas]
MQRQSLPHTSEDPATELQEQNMPSSSKRLLILLVRWILRFIKVYGTGCHLFSQSGSSKSTGSPISVINLLNMFSIPLVTAPCMAGMPLAVDQLQ